MQYHKMNSDPVKYGDLKYSNGLQLKFQTQQLALLMTFNFFHVTKHQKISRYY